MLALLLSLPPLRLQVVLEAFLNLLNRDVGLGHALVAANNAATCSVQSQSLCHVLHNVLNLGNGDAVPQQSKLA